MDTNGPYWGIKVAFPSGNEYWFSDKDDCFYLEINEERAKPFLTEGSAKRFIEKIKVKFPRAAKYFTYRVQKMGVQ